MTKEIKILIVLISILIITSLLTLSFQIQNKTDNLTPTSYNARKEDLQVKQAELEEIILDLNKTLQEEKLKQLALSNELASLKNQSPSIPSSVPSSPSPKPTPPPVTRAS